MKTIIKKQGKMIGHILRHDSIIKNIIEINRVRGRPRINYTNQIKVDMKREGRCHVVCGALEINNSIIAPARPKILNFIF